MPKHPLPVPRIQGKLGLSILLANKKIFGSSAKQQNTRLPSTPETVVAAAATVGDFWWLPLQKNRRKEELWVSERQSKSKFWGGEGGGCVFARKKEEGGAVLWAIWKMDGRAFGEREEVVRHGGRKRRIDGNHNRGGSWGEVYFFRSKSRGFRAPTLAPYTYSCSKTFRQSWLEKYLHQKSLVAVAPKRKENSSWKSNPRSRIEAAVNISLFYSSVWPPPPSDALSVHVISFSSSSSAAAGSSGKSQEEEKSRWKLCPIKTYYNQNKETGGRLLESFSRQPKMQGGEGRTFLGAPDMTV